MTSRYGLWIVCVSAIGLAGCANWQNRTGSTGPGIAANFQSGSAAGPAVVAPAPGVAPGTTFNEPPPPVPPPPSDPGLALAPLGSAPAQRLDLSAAPEGNDGPSPDKMYNLGGGPKPAVSSSSSSAKPGSSTLSKLATKAGTSSKSSSSSSQSGLSTVERLKKASSSSSRNNDSSALPAPEKKAAASAIVEPAPKASSKKVPESTMLDTALLAQPVRKGSGSDEKKDSDSSKGPQSSVAPAKKPFEKNKALIYPVSSPASESPVDITQFS